MQTSPISVSASPVLLRVGARAPRPVLAMRGREAISQLFAFDVTVSADRDEDFGAAIGEPATLVFEPGEGRTAPDRWIHGVITKVTLEGRASHGGRGFKVRIAPRFDLGRHRVTSRVFTDKTVPEIAKDVLTSAGLSCDDRLAKKYVERAYCVQYRESDVAFVRRILAEEGIFFWFDHGKLDGGKDTLVLFDKAEAYPRLEPRTLHLRRRDGSDHHGAKGDDVLAFRISEEVAPTDVRLRDYDFKKPLLDLTAAASVSENASPGAGQLGIYDHRGEYEQPAVDAERAATHLAQHRRDAVIGRGSSAVRTLAPAHRFRLEAEAAGELSNDYALVLVEHEVRPAEASRANALYENTFTCVPASFAFRPRRPKRRTRQVLETAVVVGPASEEIHTDAFGRVQVRFHWDAGSAEGSSSTWLRVIQPWAGASFGAQFVPRVGAEVMVSFLGGDPDCPVVVGGVYNATHPPPFALPAHKTKSGFLSRTSPGGAGANELSFDDAAGEEQVRIHAQRDFENAIERDASFTVGRNSVRIVKGHERAEVQGDVRGGIGGSSELVVAGSSALKVAGSHAETVGGMLDVTATGGRSIKVLGRDFVEIASARDETIGGDLTKRVIGSSTTTIGTSDAKRAHVLHVDGTSTTTATEMIEISSDLGIRFICGKSVLEIGPDRISVTSPTIELRAPKARILVGDDTVKIKAEKQLQALTKEVIVKTDDASISLTKEVKVDGKQILLNSPALAQDPIKDTPKPPTIVNLVDENDKPIPNQRYLISMPDGSERSGFVDENGHAEIELDDAATLTFPGLLEADTA